MEIQIPWTISPQPNVYKAAKNDKKDDFVKITNKRTAPEGGSLVLGGELISQWSLVIGHWQILHKTFIAGFETQRNSDELIGPHGCIPPR